MVEVKPSRFTCLSCSDREARAYDIRMGADDNNKTVVTLCCSCLENLYNEIAETLNK